MAKSLAVYGVLFLVSSTIGGDIRLDPSKDEKKEPEKKPNIVKDYVCLRDGELCHPNFASNRGVYVSCSNGVAWEQQCPRCAYHPLTCPTRTLWFDGEKCEWASPKLASQPCIDRFPVYEHGPDKEKEHGMSEQEALLQSLQVGPVQMSANSMKEPSQGDKGKWPGSQMPPPMYFKSPKSGEFDSEPVQDIDDNNQQEVKAVPEPSHVVDEDADNDDDFVSPKNKVLRRKAAEPSEPDFPTYLSPEDGAIGSKIVRLSEPVYALVNSPDGSGKQVLMRVFQPFVFEDTGRTLLPQFRNPYE